MSGEGKVHVVINRNQNLNQNQKPETRNKNDEENPNSRKFWTNGRTELLLHILREQAQDIGDVSSQFTPFRPKRI